MLAAYVLIRIKPGMDRQVLQKIKRLNPVKVVETLYGEYDMLLKVEIETLDELDTFIFDTIRTIKGVESSTTLIVIKVPGE